MESCPSRATALGRDSSPVCAMTSGRLGSAATVEDSSMPDHRLISFFHSVTMITCPFSGGWLVQSQPLHRDGVLFLVFGDREIERLILITGALQRQPHALAERAADFVRRRADKLAVAVNIGATFKGIDAHGAHLTAGGRRRGGWCRRGR